MAFGKELTIPFKFIERTRTVSPRRSFSRKRLFRCGGFLNCQFLVYILDLAAQLGPLGFQFFIDAGRFGKLVDVADRLIGGVLRILKDLLSFLAGFGKHFFLLLGETFFLLLEAVLQRFNFLFIGGDLFALFFNGHAAVFQIGKQILEGFVLLLHLVFRLVR